MAKQLWKQLTSKFDIFGQAIKDAKMWCKVIKNKQIFYLINQKQKDISLCIITVIQVYADQKQLIKRKLTFKKSSKRTGGGPYEEKVLPQVD